jgi:uncharacterized membrane protein YoaT (DUF817 family)
MLRPLALPRPLQLLLHFTYQEAASCFFPGLIFLLLAFTRLVEIPGLPRYDFMLLACILIQIWMVRGLKVETVDELKVITLFHAIAMAMEVFKVGIGSWQYPEFAYTKVFGVPLFAGFMYSSVASYITQAWRRLHLRVEHFPPSWVNWLFALLIYGNFYSHHFVYDIRWLLMVALFGVYWRTRIYFGLDSQTFWMPLVLGFALVGLFIWFAENLGTLLGAWQYPNQTAGWKMVPISKMVSWYLLFIVSFILVAQLKRIKAHRGGEGMF